MKKSFILALAILMGAVSTTALAGKKKDKKKAKTETVDAVPAEVINLVTKADSLSYAFGKAATKGLAEYLSSSMDVDSAHFADFIRGYMDAVEKKDDPAQIAYMAGANIQQQVMKGMIPSIAKELEGTNISIDEKLFHKGFTSALSQDSTLFTDEAASEYFENNLRVIKEKRDETYKKENEQWLAKNAQKEGVVTLPSGLQYKVITMGQGEKPTADETVEVKYEGKTIDGNIFDSSYKRNPQTVQFACNQVIKGWTEALQLMPVGSKWELYIPQDLAYGERQAGQIKPFSTLIFTVELLDIIKPEVEEPVQASKLPAEKTAAKTKKTSKKK
ncbi:MAG: FKBP-type peptidyl-prolyl cis-trans isomerase [Prevotella sp.]|nr:FKBP-type peptidyl-prolyl cis-trans isomerase [Prevotella sp.]